LLASSTEFRPDIARQTAETSSTGVLEIEGPGARRQKLLKSLHFDVVESWDKVPNSKELLRILDIILRRGFSFKRHPSESITLDREITFLPRGMMSVRNLIESLKMHARGELAIIWDGVGAKTVITVSEERIAFEKKRAHGKMAVLWKAGTKRDDSRPNLAKELSDNLMKLDVMEATIHSRFQELIIAFDAAVKQDIALECWAAQSLAASELFEAVIKHVNFNWNFHVPRRRPSGAYVQAALAAWHAESPEGYQAWMEARMAASAREAGKKAWKVAKNALQQVEKIMAEISVFNLKLDFLVWMFLIETHGDRDTLDRKYCKQYFKELEGMDLWDSSNMDTWDISKMDTWDILNKDTWDGSNKDAWDSLNDFCLVEFESRHLHQCPQGLQIYYWWVENRKEHMLNGEEMSDGRFVEMVGIIKKTIHKSQTLEMLVGGWQHSREENFLWTLYGDGWNN
jgi:hypothetical protein